MRMSTKGHKAEDLGKGGDFGPEPEPGTYHAIVKSVREHFPKVPDKVLVEFEVLAGTHPGQKGKTKTEFFPYDENDLKDVDIERFTRLAWACGHIAEDEEKDVDLQELVGKQLVIRLEERNYKVTREDHPDFGKTKKALNLSRDGGMWPLNHPEVETVPKDQEALKLRDSSTPAQSSSATSETAAATSSGGAEEMDDLFG